MAADTLHVVHYTRPDLPQIMTDPAERAVYYVKHYWDGYLTGDTAWVNSGDTEQLYVDFIDALTPALLLEPVFFCVVAICSVTQSGALPDET